MTKFYLKETPVHLGLGATCMPLEPFDGTMQWYERYGEAHDSDGREGRLVAVHSFSDDWPTWEMHPQGHELVVVLSGCMRLVQLVGGEQVCTELRSGEAAINPPGVWHTGRVSESATALFITAGLGTENRPEPPDPDR
jgi:mannose-6-phosphate isomerase-like protein (cupin superfamily)